MFCAHCGATNDDNAYRCTSCGQPLARPGQPIVTPPDGSGLGPAPSYLALSIIVTVMCCMPAGVVAIVYSAQTMSHNSAGQFAKAHQTSRIAKLWGFTGLGVGALVVGGYLTLMLAGAILSTV